MTVEIRLFLLQKTKITSCLLTHIFVYLHTHCSRMFQNVLKMVKFRLHRQGGIIKSLLRVFGSHLKISDFLQIRLQHNLINAFNIRWQSSFLHCCLCEKKSPRMTTWHTREKTPTVSQRIQKLSDPLRWQLRLMIPSHVNRHAIDTQTLPSFSGWIKQRVYVWMTTPSFAVWGSSVAKSHCLVH